MIKQKRGRTPGNPPPPHLIVPDPNKPGEMVKITDSKDFRLLGSNLQPNISWKAHLETGSKAVLPAIRKQIGALKQLGAQIPKQSRKAIAEGLIQSKFNYLIAQWGGATKNLMKAAQRLQNKAARWVTCSSRRTRTRKLLKDTGWLSILEMTKYHTLVQLWKIIRLQKPLIMTELFTTTNEDLITTTIPRLQFTKQGFRWRSADTWNLLPGEIRSIQNLPKFKRQVKNWIKSLRNPEPD